MKITKVTALCQQGAKSQFGSDACEYFDHKGTRNRNPILYSEEEETKGNLKKEISTTTLAETSSTMVAAKVPTNNKATATSVTSIRIFRHELLLLDGVGMSSDNSSPTRNNHSSYIHSVNLVSSDLKDCKNGDDILKKGVQLAEIYNSLLFTFDSDLADKIIRKEKNITYNFHNLDPTSSQFKAMDIHDILRKGCNNGNETVQIEMTINDVIQRNSLQHSSIICV